MTAAAPSLQSDEEPVFYLGTGMPHWLWNDAVHVPLFPSHTRLSEYVTLRRATTSWALDSGGFTELQRHGCWDRVPPRQYVEAVLRYDTEIGGLDWAAPQDWMCEPEIIHGGTFGGHRFAGTGLTVREHLHRTVDNYVQLLALWEELAPNWNKGAPFMPVLQGYEIDEYLACIDLYAAAGVDLFAGTDPADITWGTIGVGSVCRRQDTTQIEQVFREIHNAGLHGLHGFGVKTQGLSRYARYLDSADSQAWSYAGRRTTSCGTLNAAGKPHKNEANCLPYALAWRERVLAAIRAGVEDVPEQLALEAS